MIMLLGDIHGDIGVLKFAIADAVQKGAKALIQVGDLGLMQHSGIDTGFYRVTKDSPIPIYFIEGNHDDCSRWLDIKEVSKVFPDGNLWYVPRGTVMEIDGRTIAFMGGAASIDKSYRLRQAMHWDPKEEVTREDIELLIKNAEGKKVDMFITHCPPQTVIDEHFDPKFKLYFGVTIDWTDPSQGLIEEAWKALDYPYIYSGHMHRFVEGMTYCILDINQTLAV
jgi:predicted phosphodiesterase